MDINRQESTDSSIAEYDSLEAIRLEQINTRRLYEVSKLGSIEDLKTLIEEDPNIVHKVLISSSNLIESPLHLSVSQGHFEFTRFFLHQKPELDVEVDSLQRTPLHLASANGGIEIVRALFEKTTSACLVRDSNGLIPLHYAVMRGEIEMVQELIKARPQSVWTKLSNGQTVLHLCVKHSHLEALKLLIEIVVIHDEEFLNAIDDSGNTILDLSLMLRQFEMVRYLLSIRGIRIGTSTMNFTASDAIKKGKRPSSLINIENFQSERPEECDQNSSSPATNKKTGSWQAWKKFIKYKGDWIQEVQGTMMLVATVIATVTFQGAVSPPGGVLQQDTTYFDRTDLSRYGNYTVVLPAGTAIMAYQQQEVYRYYLLANTISFLASVSVILLVISRCPLKNRISGWVLTLAMCAAVAFLAMGYILGIRMVSLNPYTRDVSVGTSTAIWIWLVIVGVVVLCFIIRFIVWAVSSFSFKR